MKLKIKTGDNVTVIAGKDKGKSGKVIQVFPKKQRVVVEGVNILKKHLRSRKQGEPGQRIELPAPLHVSNVKKTAAPAKKKDEKKGSTKAADKKTDKPVAKDSKKTDSKKK